VQEVLLADLGLREQAAAVTASVEGAAMESRRVAAGLALLRQVRQVRQRRGLLLQNLVLLLLQLGLSLSLSARYRGLLRRYHCHDLTVVFLPFMARYRAFNFKLFVQSVGGQKKPPMWRNWLFAFE
jgi:hypothetical protein